MTTTMTARTAPGGTKAVSITHIVHQACRRLGVEVVDLMGTGRAPRVVLARWICFHLARRYTCLSYPEIARSMGRPTHSTVIAGERALAALLAPPPEEQGEGGDGVVGARVVMEPPLREVYAAIERAVRVAAGIDAVREGGEVVQP